MMSLLIFAGCRPQTAPPAAMPVQHAAVSQIRFEDVTKHSGITWVRRNGEFGKKWMPETLGGGGAFFDYDGDGYLDILLVNGDWWPGHKLDGKRPTPAVYHNNRDGTFSDVTSAVGMDVPMQGMGVAIGDYDNDGFDDICITCVGGCRLFHNEHGRRFTDVSAASGINTAGWATSAAWLDYDNDGRLDLFVCHYIRWSPETDLFCGDQKKSYCTPAHYHGESCRLYHNDGGGHFSDVTQRAGLMNENMKGLGVCTIDYDHDGLIDILVANDLAPNSVYRNNGDGTFKDVSLESGIAMAESGVPRSGMGIDAADYRNDGKLSVLIGNFSTQGIGLYSEVQKGSFRDNAHDAGIAQPSYPYVTFGTLFCDFDNSGWKSALITNGHVDDLIHEKEPDKQYRQPTLVFANQKNGAFADVTEASGLEAAKSLVGRGVCWGDFDNDGRPDLLLIQNKGAPLLLHNEAPIANHWITLELVGSKSNRDAYGAFVRLTARGMTQSDTVRSGSSYCSQSDKRLHFGLGDAPAVETIDVRWPDGRQDIWHNLGANHFWQIAEGHEPVCAR